jgi:cytochrome c oxidase subunit 2
MLAEMMYGNWYPPQLSRHGGDIDRIIDVVHVFMLAIFIPWGLFFVYCLTKFRKREGNTARYHPIKAKVSKYGEILVAVVEVVLLLAFSMPVWAEYKNKPPTPEQRLEVRVIAEQFQWDFHYPGPNGKFGRTDPKLITASNVLGLVEDDPDGLDDIVRVNEFHIPVGVPIYLKLRSKDVIHSFDIPTMRVKQDVIPGMEIPIWFQANEDALSDRIREQMTKDYEVQGAEWYKLRHLIVAADVVDPKTKEVIIARGGDLGMNLQKGDEMISRLQKAGVTTIKMQPRNPLEVVCAQLCGNSHFKMKAQMITQTPAEFTEWVKTASKKVELQQDF